MILVINTEVPNQFSCPYCADTSSGTATLAEKEEADARSIYVGNVRLHYSILLPPLCCTDLVMFMVILCPITRLIEGK